ncbi:MAG: ROK family protein, partial [Acidobacteriota bacterium]
MGNAENKRRIGVDLGGTKIEAAALDPDGRLLARRRIATPSGDYDATLRAVRDLVLAVEAELGSRCTVGVGTPGALSPATGLIKNANSTCLNGHPLDRDLSQALARPVRIANDADCFALSEAIDGAAAGLATVFGVILGTGVGGGVVVRRRLLSGPNAIAGEWGHSPLPWPRDDERPGPLCFCGKRGCTEAFLAGRGLAGDHAAHTGEQLEPPEIAARAASGEPAAQASIRRYEDRLARALAVVINLIDPHAIVLGGGLGRIERLYANVPLLWG